MRRFPLAVLLVAGTLAGALSGAFAGAQPVPPGASEIRALVAKLGSDEFADREAATKRLDEIGAAAITELRAGCKSENPEIARRSQDILRRVERRLANEKTLAPTLVELDAKDKRLDDVLADLSKQAKCEVVVGGLKPKELADRKVTVSTGGKVPFWTAVLKVCDAADAQIMSAGGFLAPDAMPYHYRARARTEFRVAWSADREVVLEARGEAPRRPAAVYGAVLVEALTLPKGSNQPEPSVLLQAWPEPRLQWQATSSVKVTAATDAAGAKLVAEPGVVTDPTVPPGGREAAILIRHPDGSASLEPAFRVAGAFSPNVRQALVRFKAADKPPGAAKEPAAVKEAKELAVTLFAMVRSGVEPLSQAGGLEANKIATGVGVPVVEMTATYRKDEKGRWIAVVSLTCDPTVQPATLSDELAGVNGGRASLGNQTVFGVRVTDADGKPFILGLSGLTGGLGAQGRRSLMQSTLEVYPDKDGQGPPATITFWGSYLKPIEVPVVLKDVPLGSGKK